MSKIVLIQGPTASGKSSLALSLAQEINAPIISADSRQFYRELNIGTAKPSKEELDLVQHFFINTHSIHDLSFTSAAFMKAGRDKISTIFNQGYKYVIVTGGSGKFVDSLIDGLHDAPSDKKVRQELNEELKQNGMDSLLLELKNADPIAFQEIDIQNPMRVLRALEIIRISGETLEKIRMKNKNAIAYPYIRFGISWDRSELYDRINKRVEQMIEHGLFEEVKNLPLQENALLKNTVGYKEWIPYFENGISFEDTIEMIQKNSRNYAKRQETWMRRYKDLILLSPYESKTMLEQIIEHI